jgi:hypothetical protein
MRESRQTLIGSFRLCRPNEPDAIFHRQEIIRDFEDAGLMGTRHDPANAPRGPAGHSLLNPTLHSRQHASRGSLDLNALPDDIAGHFHFEVPIRIVEIERE